MSSTVFVKEFRISRPTRYTAHARTFPNCHRPVNRRTYPSQNGRVSATPEAASGALAIVGSLGIVGGTLFAALYVLELQSKELLLRKVKRLEEDVRERDRQLVAAKEEVERAEERVRENESIRKRYADASRDIFKLERALELKDGQLESFMVVAQRQIAYLESQMRQLQKSD